MFPEAKESLFIIKSSSDSRMIPKALDQGVMKTTSESHHMVCLHLTGKRLYIDPKESTHRTLHVTWKTYLCYRQPLYFGQASSKFGNFKRDFKTKAGKAKGDTDRPRKWHFLHYKDKHQNNAYDMINKQFNDGQDRWNACHQSLSKQPLLQSYSCKRRIWLWLLRGRTKQTVSYFPEASFYWFCQFGFNLSTNQTLITSQQLTCFVFMGGPMTSGNEEKRIKVGNTEEKQHQCIWPRPENTNSGEVLPLIYFDSCLSWSGIHTEVQLRGLAGSQYNISTQIN